jgi:hypothetical protein
VEFSHKAYATPFEESPQEVGAHKITSNQDLCANCARAGSYTVVVIYVV